jgi:anion-transporting  ArsA/GET3 family ATPase
MPYEVTDLELIELSLVDEPANPAARVVMFKRSGMMPDEMKIKELIAEGMSEADARNQVAQMRRNKGAGPTGDLGTGDLSMSDQEKRLEELEATNKRLEASRDALVKSLETEGYVVQIADDAVTVEKRQAEDYIDVAGEPVLKSALPASVIAMISKQAGELAEATKRLEAEELVKRVSAEIPHLAGAPTMKGAVLKAIDAIADVEVRKAAHAMLKGANTLASKLTREFGTVAPEETDAMTELNKMAEEYAVEKKVTFAKAFADVTRTGRGAELFAKRNVQ